MAGGGTGRARARPTSFSPPLFPSPEEEADHHLTISSTPPYESVCGEGGDAGEELHGGVQGVGRTASDAHQPWPRLLLAPHWLDGGQTWTDEGSRLLWRALMRPVQRLVPRPPPKTPGSVGGTPSRREGWAPRRLGAPK